MAYFAALARGTSVGLRGSNVFAVLGASARLQRIQYAQMQKGGPRAALCVMT